jgi:hypothetical protein
MLIPRGPRRFRLLSVVVTDFYKVYDHRGQYRREVTCDNKPLSGCLHLVGLDADTLRPFQIPDTTAEF